jgi:hypothetical protein
MNKLPDECPLREELIMFDKYLMHCENQAKTLKNLDRILEVGHIRALFKETFMCKEMMKDD